MALPRRPLPCSCELTGGVLRHYSNRPDLLQHLRKVAVILVDGGRDHQVGDGAKQETQVVTRLRRLCDRFSSEDLQTMIDLYKSGATAKEVAERFGISVRSGT